MSPIDEPADFDEPALLDNYKLAVEMADRVSARRGTTNAFFIILQCLLVATVALLGTATAAVGAAAKTSITGLCVVGMIASVAWFFQLQGYLAISDAKAQVILNLEKRTSAKIFRPEWKRLRVVRFAWLPKFTELSLLEQLVPAAFCVVDLALLIVFLAL